MRKLRTLGVALVAVVALGVVMASAAQASKFTASEYPATITGEQEAGQINRLTIGSNYFQCGTGNYHGTMTEASSTLTTTIDITGCETSFGTEATVDNNGCDYLLHSGAEVTPDVFSATLDLVCPVEKEVTITLGLCTIHIKPQKGLGGVILTNKTEGTRKDVTVDTSIQLEANVTNVFLCPLTTGVQTVTTDGKDTYKAYKDGPPEGAQLDFWVD